MRNPPPKPVNEAAVPTKTPMPISKIFEVTLIHLHVIVPRVKPFMQILPHSYNYLKEIPAFAEVRRKILDERHIPPEKYHTPKTP